MNVKRLAPAAVLAFALAAPAAALAWGNAPTHFSIGAANADTIKARYSDAFVHAAAAPDLAWTPLFRAAGLTYVHSLDFAYSLLAVAKTRGNGKWLAMALAWGAHLKADEVGHQKNGGISSGFIPEPEPIQALVEVAVDTVIFYDPALAPPKSFSSWDQVNVSFDANLLYYASLDYRQRGHQVPLVFPWVATQALNGLKNSINSEYSYIKLKKDASLSQAYLKDLAEKDIVPDDFVPYYDASVAAAKQWIVDND